MTKQKIITDKKILERIAQSTLGGGLQVLPVGFDSESGDWVTIRSDDPATMLYLEPEYQDVITSEMIERNFALLDAFWEHVGSLLEVTALRPTLVRRYCGAEGDNSIVKAYRTRLRDAYEKVLRQKELSNSANALDSCHSTSENEGGEALPHFPPFGEGLGQRGNAEDFESMMGEFQRKLAGVREASERVGIPHVETDILKEKRRLFEILKMKRDRRADRGVRLKRFIPRIRVSGKVILMAAIVAAAGVGMWLYAGYHRTLPGGIMYVAGDSQFSSIPMYEMKDNPSSKMANLYYGSKVYILEGNRKVDDVWMVLYHGRKGYVRSDALTPENPDSLFRISQKGAVAFDLPQRLIGTIGDASKIRIDLGQHGYLLDGRVEIDWLEPERSIEGTLLTEEQIIGRVNYTSRKVELGLSRGDAFIGKIEFSCPEQPGAFNGTFAWLDNRTQYKLTLDIDRTGR